MKHELTGSGGKGSAPRTVDKQKFDDNFDRIFGGKGKDPKLNATKGYKSPPGCFTPERGNKCDCPACGGFND